MEENVKNNYLLGILGALVGALIGAIPWILMYVFANMMYAIFSILIVICSFYGYKITKAKIDKKLPIILSITSFLSITITMFIIIPICMIIQNGIEVNIEVFKFIYSNNEFLTAIVSDYVISLVFGIVVISGIIINLNKQLKSGVENKDIKIIAQDAGNETFSKEEIEKVKNAFEKNEALDKKHTITKELIIEELNKEFDEEKAREIFDYLKVQQVIKKSSGKYYFSEKAQKSAFHRYGLTSLKTFIIVILLATLIAGIIIFIENKNNNSNNTNTLSQENRSNIYELGTNNIKLEMPEGMTILTDSEINYYFGANYSNLYDCLAVSSDFEKIIMVFSADKKDNQTAEQYLKEAIGNKEINVAQRKIQNNIFYVVEFEYEENGKKYSTIDCIYDAGDKFICMVFDSLADDKLNIEDIIK